MPTTDALGVAVALDDDDMAQILSAEDVTTPDISAGDLENLDSGLKVYSVEAGGVLRKIAGIVGFDANLAKIGLIQETMKYTVRSNPSRPGVEQVYGVSVRLLVAATDWKSDVKVTVPSVAASGELGFRTARVKIQIRGYDGDVGNLLPAPSALDVTSYTRYIVAYEKIQKKVISDERHHQPVLLEERVAGSTDEDG